MVARREQLGLPRGCTCYYQWDFPSATWLLISRNRCALHGDLGGSPQRRARSAQQVTPANLTPELIPEPLWNISAAVLAGRTSTAWRQIRSSALADAGDACSACGEVSAGGKYMVCDELWDYDEQHGVATLTGVRILCPACNLARHFARAAQLGKGAGTLAALARANGISEAEARAIQDDAVMVWKRRSRRSWTVRVSGDLLSRYPFLAKLDGQSGAPGHGRAKTAAADEQAAGRSQDTG